jgi:hypothetical protein
MSVKSLRKKQAYESKKDLEVPEPPTLPRYNAAKVLELFRNNDSRIRMNDYGTEKSIQLAEEPGYFRFSDKNGGTATFYAVTYNPYKATPTFTAAVEITNEMRAAKCINPDCKCNADWTRITYDCGCTQHHDGERYHVIPRIETCSIEAGCDGLHAHLIGLCSICFDMEEEEGKEGIDMKADGFHLQLR